MNDLPEHISSENVKEQIKFINSLDSKEIIESLSEICKHFDKAIDDINNNYRNDCFIRETNIGLIETSLYFWTHAGLDTMPTKQIPVHSYPVMSEVQTRLQLLIKTQYLNNWYN